MKEIRRNEELKNAFDNDFLSVPVRPNPPGPRKPTHQVRKSSAPMVNRENIYNIPQVKRSSSAVNLGSAYARPAGNGPRIQRPVPAGPEPQTYKPNWPTNPRSYTPQIPRRPVPSGLESHRPVSPLTTEEMNAPDDGKSISPVSSTFSRRNSRSKAAAKAPSDSSSESHIGVDISAFADPFDGTGAKFAGNAVDPSAKFVRASVAAS